MALRLALAFVAGLTVLTGAAAAGQRAAVFPFEIDLQPTEEDFFIGEAKPSDDEVKRLALVGAEFLRLLAGDGRYEAVDLAPYEAEIKSAQPLHSCNECDIDIARKAGAEVSFTTVIDKISETHLNMIITVRNVATGAPLRTMQAVIQGNTDETWLHGARWIVKNRLFAEASEK
jgi:hypothetical protein